MIHNATHHDGAKADFRTMLRPSSTVMSAIHPSNGDTAFFRADEPQNAGSQCWRTARRSIVRMMHMIRAGSFHVNQR